MEIYEVRIKISEDAYEKDENQFYEDLCSANGMDPKDVLSKRIYAYAWEKGHAYGRMEVLSFFVDLVEVYNGEE